MFGILQRGMVLALILTGGAALAQTRAAPPVSAVGDPNCLVTDKNENCLLRCENRALELSVQRSGDILLVFHGAAPASAKSVSSQTDLVAALNAGTISADDATVISLDLTHGDGAVYEVPDLAKLKLDLGFPDNQEISINDWPDLLRADVQRMLGVDARTASYIASRIEVVMPPGPQADASDAINATHN